MNDIGDVDLRDPRESDGPATSLMRSTDRARRTLRRAQLFLGALAVVAAVPVGMAAAAEPPPDHGAATVRAELLEPAPAPEVAVVGAAVPTPARWTGPDGTTHTGLAWVDAGLARGAVVTVTLDPTDAGAAEQVDVEDPSLSGLLAGLATLLTCWAALVVAASVWRARLAERDAVDWESGWVRVEPVWSGRA